MIKLGTIVVKDPTSVQDEIRRESGEVRTTPPDDPVFRVRQPLQTEQPRSLNREDAPSEVINREVKKKPRKKKTVLQKSLSIKSSQYLKDTFEGE